MEKQTQSEVTRSIDNRFGSISKTDRSNIEVNIIRWNNGRKKLDIRVWSSDGKCTKKGVTFSREEYYQLIRILTAIDPLLIDSGKAARTEPESRQKERAAAAEEQLAGYRSTMEAAFAEEDDYDLTVMGRTQGQGCYCFVNGLVQTQVQKLQSHYPYIVVDNEAGMEHISRGILPMMEVAILVSDCSRRGVQAAGRIAKLMKELNFKPQKTGLIVNRVPDGKLDAGTLEEIRNQGLELLGVVPHDDQVYQYDCDGKPIIRLPKDSPVRSALGEIVKKLGL